MVSVEESRAPTECTPHRGHMPKQSWTDTSGCSPGQKGIWDGFFYLFLAKTSPFSSICSCPDLVEATTFAAISLTLREHSWSLARFLLLFSAFTCNEHRDGCGCPP